MTHGDGIEMMRIAVASDDGVTVREGHFGAALGYEIFELSGGGIRHVERRGPVEGKEGHGPQEALAVLDHLRDCRVFVGRSMGRRSRDLLLERGVLALVTSTDDVGRAASEAADTLTQNGG